LNPLPAPAERVRQAAAERGLDIEIRIMPDSTRTAAEAAAVCGCSVGEIVKSLIFKGTKTGVPVLLLVSGTNRVNEKTVENVLGEAISRPDAAFVREATGFAIGGIPPIGHANPVRTYIDRDLLQYETVWAAAGTPHAVFRVAPGALSEAAGAEIITVT